MNMTTQIGLRLLPVGFIALCLSGCMIVAPIPEPKPVVVVATPAPEKVVVAEPAPVVVAPKVKASPVVKTTPKQVVKTAPAAKKVVKPVVKRSYPTIVFTSHPKWLAKSPYLNRQIEGGPNFAEHYSVAYISCGQNCRDNLIIDMNTGYIIDEVRSCGTPEFSLHSDIINIPVRPTEYSECRMVSYKIDDQVLIRL